MGVFKIKAEDIQNVVAGTENALRIINYATDEIRGCLSNLRGEMEGATGEEYTAKLNSVLDFTDSLSNKIDNFRKAVDDFCQKTGMNVSVNVSDKSENLEETMKVLSNQASEFSGK